MSVPQPPTAHKLLTRKWREENINKHYHRINDVRPVVECHNTSNYFPHLVSKPKTRQMNEGKSFHADHLCWSHCLSLTQVEKYEIQEQFVKTVMEYSPSLESMVFMVKS